MEKLWVLIFIVILSSIHWIIHYFFGEFGWKIAWNGAMLMVAVYIMYEGFRPYKK